MIGMGLKKPVSLESINSKGANSDFLFSPFFLLHTVTQKDIKVQSLIPLVMLINGAVSSAD